MIALVGGGITGAYLAFMLAKIGSEVTVYDAYSLSYAGTGCNPGGINPFHGPGMPGVMADFYIKSYREHLGNCAEVAELSGIDFDLRMVNRLFLAFSRKDVDKLRRMEPYYLATNNFDAHWLSTEQIIERDSRISAEVLGGLYTTGNLTVDTSLYQKALIAAACKLGVKFVTKDVTQLLISDNRVTHIIADEKSVPVSAVALTNGVWATALLGSLNSSLTVDAVKGELLLVDMKDSPFSFDVTHELTGLYQHKDNLYWVGGTKSDPSMNPGVTSAGKDSLLRNLSKIIPGIKVDHIVGHYAGYRPVTEGLLPAIGKLSKYANVFVGTGGGSKGILLSAGIGHTLAQLINGFDVTEIDFLSPDRFDK
jgi:glycine oxidase